MSITFYSAPHSTANITSAVLAELDHNQPAPLTTRVTLSLSAGDTRTPSYLRSVNPNGRVPALVLADGTAIWESAAITLFLGDEYGAGRGLWPVGGVRRAEAIKWVVWGAVTLAEAGGKVAGALEVGAAGGVEEGTLDAGRRGTDREAQGRKAREDVAGLLGILDSALEGRDFLLRAGYCLADTHLWSLVGWLQVMGVGLEPYANVGAWEARIAARPALKYE